MTLFLSIFSRSLAAGHRPDLAEEAAQSAQQKPTLPEACIRRDTHLRNNTLCRKRLLLCEYAQHIHVYAYYSSFLIELFLFTYCHYSSVSFILNSLLLSPFPPLSLSDSNSLSQAHGFLDKNRDTFSADLFDLLQMSASPFIQTLFRGEKAMVRKCSRSLH